MPKIKVRKPKRQLMRHQKDAYKYAIQRKRIALFMEMRLGKSLVTIRWADHHNLDPVLIIGPLSTLISWQHELKLERKKTTLLLGNKEQRLSAVFMADTKGYYLINYEGIRSVPEILLDGPWQAIVVDESTYIKNPKADITKILHADTAHIEHKAILSGLPNPEGPLDLFSQFKFLKGSFMQSSSYYQFTHRHFEKSGYDLVPKPNTLARIKSYAHHNAFVLSRKDAGIGNKKIYEIRHSFMNKEQKKAYNELLNAWTVKDIIIKWVTVQLNYLLQITGGFWPNVDEAPGTGADFIGSTKFKILEDLLTNELKGQQVVVWFAFNQELRQAFNALKPAHPSCYSITGETSPARRLELTEQFKKGQARILLCQQKVGKFSFDWSAASTAIYFSRNYSVEDRKQSEDRIEHPKKKHPLLYIDLVTYNSVDEEALIDLKNKSSSAKLLLRKVFDSWKRK